MWPEPLQRVFARAATRTRWLAVARASAVALCVSLVFMAARIAGLMPTGWAIGCSAGVIAATCAWAIRRAPRSAVALASAIESRTPAAQNLLVTAAELLERPTPIRADVRDVVLRDAAEAAARVDVAALFPARRYVITVIAAAVVWSATLLVDRAWIARAADVARGGSGAPAVTRVIVTVTPPSYTGRPAATLNDPERIDAMAGSVLHVAVGATAAQIDLSVAGERHALARAQDGAFAGDVTATADGLLTLQPFGATGDVGVRRVIAVVVTPDRAPAARIVTPGKDLFLTSTNAPVPVSIEATDDIALSSLRVTYTEKYSIPSCSFLVITFFIGDFSSSAISALMNSLKVSWST